MRYHPINARAETSVQQPIPCAQCGEPLVAATWSEHLSDRCIRHLWHCHACGYEFETAVYLKAEEPQATLSAA